MKKILFALLALLPLLASAQKRAAIEFHASPNYTNFTERISKVGKGKLGYDAGINLTIPTKNGRLEWIGGLQLSSYGTKNKIDTLRWGTQHDGNGGYNPNAPSGVTSTGVESKHNYYFLQIPLGIRYYLSPKKIRLFFQPTLAPSIYLTQHNKTTFIHSESDSSWGGQTGIRKTNLFAALGVGLEIPINNKIGIQVQPHGGIQLLTAAKDSATGARLYSAGLDISFRYCFF